MKHLPLLFGFLYAILGALVIGAVFGFIHLTPPVFIALIVVKSICLFMGLYFIGR